MPLEIVSLDHVPAKFAIHVALFHNVRNAAFLQRQLLDRNAEFEYAFVDASIILSRNHILSAVFKAIIAQAQGTLETPNIHSEIVVHLSPSHNIADAYRRFGISPATTHLAVIKITFPTDTCQEPASSHVIWHHLSENVHGDAVSMTNENLEAVTVLPKVRKYYKINDVSWLPKTDGPGYRSQLEALVLTSMALRGL